MSRGKWSVAARLVTFAGAGMVAVGAWLPRLTVRPGYEGPVPAVHLPGMDAGFAGLDWLALAAAAVAVVGVVPTSEPRIGGRRGALAAVLAGGFVAALTVVSLVSNDFLGVFVPGAGFYLTALGGVHLSVGGALRLHALSGAD